jgi:hypothetical protein
VDRAACEVPVSPDSRDEVEGLASEDELGPWGVVLALAEEMDPDEASAHGMGPAPGAFEDAIERLSDVERSELVRLIREELRIAG